MNKYAEALHLVREKEPLVQCITNFVTVNDCANIILAAGGSPSMAHDVREAAEAARNARALVCNMGAIEDAPSMILAGKEMNKLGRPVVLDPVAAGGTSLRREVAAELLKEVTVQLHSWKCVRDPLSGRTADRRKWCGCKRP